MTSFKKINTLEHQTNLLQDFALCSGLKVDDSKLDALTLGDDAPSFNIGLGNTTKPIKILGIFFSYNKTEAYRLNFESTLEKLKKDTTCGSGKIGQS